MPNLNGNIHSHVFYGSVMSEFVRIARSTLRYTDFLPVAISLYNRMLKQGGARNKLLKQIFKATSRRFSSFNYDKLTSEIINDIQYG